MDGYKDMKSWWLNAAEIPTREAHHMASAADLKAHAQNLCPDQAPQSTNFVLCRGEEVSKPIYWQGRQWAVTNYGVEARDGTYVIDKTRLWEEEKRYGWVRHMAGKNWVDLPDFAEALRIARRHYELASALNRHLND